MWDTGRRVGKEWGRFKDRKFGVSKKKKKEKGVNGEMWKFRG